MMAMPSPAACHSAAVKAASVARLAASLMGGGVTADAQTKLGLALAYANAGRFGDAYTKIDQLANDQTAWVPCMLILRAGRAAFGNAAGPMGEVEPCQVCQNPKPAVFTGERLCLVCMENPQPAATGGTVSRV